MVTDVRPARDTGVPFFSIVIPCYNRERLVRRAIDSCLNQDCTDFELIVVDDGSTDGTAESVLAYSDPRVRLLRHAQNRGLCPTRNTGIAAAYGEWVLTFDSDDELLPGALARFHQLAVTAPAEITRLAFMQLNDDGSTSPPEPFADEVWDYTGYLRWREHWIRQYEYCHCTRAAAYRELRFPDSRAWETIHYFDFARRFKTRTVPEIWLARHADAQERLGRYRAVNLLPQAADHAASFAGGLERHGAALALYAPRMLNRLQILAMNFSFLSGQRATGRRHAASLFQRRPLAPLFWLAPLLGSLGPRTYAAGLDLLWRLRGVRR